MRMRSNNHWAGVSNHGMSDGVSNNGVSDGVGNNGVGSNSDSGPVLGGAGVGDVLDDSVPVVRVGDSLDPAVRQVDRVAPGGGVSVSLLRLGEVGPAVVVRHAVLVAVDRRLGEIIRHVARPGVGNQHSGR